MNIRRVIVTSYAALIFGVGGCGGGSVALAPGRATAAPTQPPVTSGQVTEALIAGTPLPLPSNAGITGSIEFAATTPFKAGSTIALQTYAGVPSSVSPAATSHVAVEARSGALSVPAGATDVASFTMTLTGSTASGGTEVPFPAVDVSLPTSLNPILGLVAQDPAGYATYEEIVDPSTGAVLDVEQGTIEGEADDDVTTEYDAILAFVLFLHAINAHPTEYAVILAFVASLQDVTPTASPTAAPTSTPASPTAQLCGVINEPPALTIDNPSTCSGGTGAQAGFGLYLCNEPPANSSCGSTPKSLTVTISEAGYAGPITAQPVACGAGGCTQPVKNGSGNLASISVAFGAPNGGVGPKTTATVSTANTYYCGPMTAAELSPLISDATGILFQDRYGQQLILLVDRYLSITQNPPGPCPTAAPT